MFDIKPSVYMYPIFIVLIYLVFKNKMYKGILREIKNICIEFKKAVLAAFFIAAVLVFAVDKPVALFFNEVNKYKITALEKISQIGNILGNGNFAYSFIVMMIAIVIILKKKERVFMLSLASTIYAGLFVTLIKALISRERPFVAFNNLDFFDFTNAVRTGFGFDYSSMPSGHTIVITALVVPFMIETKKMWLRILLVVFPLMTAFDRIYSTAHWTSDVFMGGFCGVVISAAVCRINRENGGIK